MAKILVIDDNQILLETTSEILKLNGYEVFATCNPTELKSLLIDQRFDLLITDIIMPDVEGLEVIIYAKEKYPDLKAIAMTGKGSEESVDILDVASGIGADDTLRKPFSSDILLKKVKTILG